MDLGPKVYIRLRIELKNRTGMYSEGIEGIANSLTSVLNKQYDENYSWRARDLYENSFELMIGYVKEIDITALQEIEETLDGKHEIKRWQFKTIEAR